MTDAPVVFYVAVFYDEQQQLNVSFLRSLANLLALARDVHKSARTSKTDGLFEAYLVDLHALECWRVNMEAYGFWTEAARGAPT